MVRVSTPQDAVEPPALLGNWQLSSLSQFLAYNFQFGFLSLGDTPPVSSFRCVYRRCASSGPVPCNLLPNVGGHTGIGHPRNHAVAQTVKALAAPAAPLSLALLPKCHGDSALCKQSAKLIGQSARLSCPSRRPSIKAREQRRAFGRNSGLAFKVFANLGMKCDNRSFFSALRAPACFLRNRPGNHRW